MGTDSSKLSYDIHIEKSKTYNSCSNRFLGESKYSVHSKVSSDLENDKTANNCDFINKSHENKIISKIYCAQSILNDYLTKNEINQHSSTSGLLKANPDQIKNVKKLNDTDQIYTDKNQKQANTDINIEASCKEKENLNQENINYENSSTNITSNYSKSLEKNQQLQPHQIIYSSQNKFSSNNIPSSNKEESVKNIKFNEKITCFRIINENNSQRVENQLNTMTNQPVLTKIKIEWIEGGNDVYLAGSYNNWQLVKLIYNPSTNTHFCELVCY
jgi:hypothetical protein